MKQPIENDILKHYLNEGELYRIVEILYYCRKNCTEKITPLIIERLLIGDVFFRLKYKEGVLIIKKETSSLCQGISCGDYKSINDFIAIEKTKFGIF